MFSTVTQSSVGMYRVRWKNGESPDSFSKRTRSVGHQVWSPPMLARAPRLTYANAMSTIAVFIALGGTSYAVARNSIGTRELKNNAVSSAKLQSRAVTSAKIRDGAIVAADLAPSARSGVRGPRGSQGPAGPAGQQGQQGPPGSQGSAEAWRALPFAPGWAHFGEGWQLGSFRKDQSGVVHLRGLVLKNVAPVAGDTIGTLPPGYRPALREMFATVTGQPSAFGRVQVETTGALRWITGNTGAEAFVNLSGISFATD